MGGRPVTYAVVAMGQPPLHDTGKRPRGRPHSLYTIGTDRIEKSRPDARLHESTGLTNERQCSAEFSIEVDDPMDLDTPSAHALPARMVARMRKRPLTTTPVDANVAKSIKPLSQTTKAQSSPSDFRVKFRDYKPPIQRRRMQARLHPSNRFTGQT